MNNFTVERNNYRRKLIMLVKQHPILWNKTQENYNRNRPQKILAWHQISEQLGISVDKLRRTWENLRDQYRRDLKREVRFGFKSKWRFFADMDFIRAMVACKEHELKETEYTDSDSELDVAENQLSKTHCSPVTPTVVPRTNLQTITPPGNSSGSSSTTLTSSILPFQPIVLSKQWQSLAQDVVAVNNDPVDTSHCVPNTHPFPDIVEIPVNCDSSKDLAETITSGSLANENIAKQEPNFDLLFDNASVTGEQQESTAAKNSLNAGKFQESCVSTSTQKRSRNSTEEISDTAIPSTSRSRIKPEKSSDLNARDDDYHFVMSLLPSLRQIPTNRKFPLRINLMSLIAKELEEVCKE